MKSNIVIIVRDGAETFKKVIALCKNESFIEWDEGNFCIIGTFDEKDLKEYEYYPLRKDGKMYDWQTASGFKDRPL